MAPEKFMRNKVIGLIQIGLSWLSDTSNTSQTEIENLKEVLEDIKKGAQGDRKLPGVAMSGLTLEEVESIFHLKKLSPSNHQDGDEWDLEPYEPSDLQSSKEFQEFLNFLHKALEYLDSAHEGSTRAEALVRARLDLILGLVLGFAKEDGRIISGGSVSWGYETPFHMKIRMKARHKMLRGRPDYALWYGAQVNLETNLVIVEAKTREELGKGERQVLAYMGLVHAGRKERQKQNATVYGITTDSTTFNFYCISHGSKWCSSTKTWGFTTVGNREIVAMLLKIMLMASTQTPSHTRENTAAHARGFSSSAGDESMMED